ncbi:MAG TPA: enoyl-CoA hydratase-related protein, partial [Candidatus Sulfotelmatobacter sp.]|nr:enoyl-CoA hydratase-related protein [Candidatus Sulfotelmatobacter sp.]
MADQAKPGEVRTEADGRVLRIIVDNVAKKNAFTPEMMLQISDAFTAFDRNDDYWVAVLAAAGDHTTAGLDMPKFFGPTASRVESPPDNLDAFALKGRTCKPVVAAVQGICFTVAIELMLAADIVIAASNCRFSQLEVKRGIMANHGATLR